MEVVSCIVLCYKNFQYIYGALDSIMMQDYPAIEIIVSDDGSANFPESEIKEYIEKNKKDNIVNYQVYSNVENVGTVKNYNGAVKKSTGEYIAPLACDDEYYDATVIRKIVDRFHEADFPLLVCRRQLCDQSTLEEKGYVPNDQEIKCITQLDTAQKQFCAFAKREYYNMASGSVMYYKKTTLEKYQLFDQRFRLWEDGPAIAILTSAGVKLPMAYDIVSLKYRDGGISAGQTVNPIIKQDDKKMYEEIIFPHLDWLDRKDRRLVTFRYNREYQYGQMSKLQKIKFMIKYIDMLVVRRIKYLKKH